MSTSNLVTDPYSTSVPPLQFTDAGLIIPTEADILAGKQEDINYAFGGNVNPALKTPQGQLASSDTAIIADKNSEIAYIANQFDPQYATGRFQDAIAAIYYLYRKGAAPTVVTCLLGGSGPVTVPAGTIAKDTAGNTYVLLGDALIPTSGAVVSTWENLATGPIACPAGTLIQPVQQINGWDTITNPADGVLGRLVETPSEFEYRRSNSVAGNAQGIAPATYGAVFQVANVLDCYVYDNGKPTAVNIGVTNFSVLAHSIYVAVVGGTDTDVANAIISKKSGGCDYTGNTTVEVTDTSGYNYPEPTYNVSFQRCTPLPIYFEVQIVNAPGLPGDIATQIADAIVSRFNGEDGTVRERIGSLIVAARYYSAIIPLSSNLVILGLTVGLAASPNTTSQGVGVEQVPTLDVSNILVTLV